MNSALYVFNALALVALVSFQFQSKAEDPAFIHVHADQMMPPPMARVANMTSINPVIAAQSASEPVAQYRTERYTF